jgi:hypothetical protein
MHANACLLACIYIHLYVSICAITFVTNVIAHTNVYMNVVGLYVYERLHECSRFLCLCMCCPPFPCECMREQGHKGEGRRSRSAE